ncbi:hypothetical protein F5Y18DRAFT_431807 [Xylariaceae sp. FL1019]|nr:hypothetical protein F5Y18DRAFT_431807 [Xylariaceae sp. FL1019]
MLLLHNERSDFPVRTSTIIRTTNFAGRCSCQHRLAKPVIDVTSSNWVVAAWVKDHERERSIGKSAPAAASRVRRLRIRPSQIKEDAVLSLEQSQLLCDSVSQPKQSSASPCAFSVPQGEKDIKILSACSSNTPFLFPDMNREDFQQQIHTVEVGQDHPSLQLHDLNFDVGQFHDTNLPESPRQILLDQLSEVNLAYDAWVSSQRAGDSSCGRYGGDDLDISRHDLSSPLSVEELFSLSQRFASTLNAAAGLGILSTCHMVDSALVLSLHSRIRDIHDIIVQVAAESLQLSNDALERISHWHRFPA